LSLAGAGERLASIGVQGVQHDTSLIQILKRPSVRYHTLSALFREGEPGFQWPRLGTDVIEQVEIQTKYEGYIQRQIQQAERHKRLENRKIPPDFDYDRVTGFSREVREKLKNVRPQSVGQASRISGVTPAAVSLLLVALERNAGRAQGSSDGKRPARNTGRHLVRAGGKNGAPGGEADVRSLLIDGCRQMGIDLKGDRADLFLTYLLLLQKWGKKLNLTKILDDREIVIKHFLDALSAFLAIEIQPNHRVMDVGSGAGIPGIPLKIVQPEIELTLVEPTLKKAAFLRTVCGALKLGTVKVLTRTVENLAGETEHRGEYDHVLVRALAVPPKRLSVLAGLLRPAGDLLLFKGNKGREVGHGLRHLRVEQEINLTLPHSREPRRLLVLRPA
jgi:16S rRNA (guanine(527)-N(7))-methyltransferase RsmG